MSPDHDTQTRIPAWLILAASTVGMGMGFGVTSSFAVFMAPLEQAFGWSRADVSFGYTLMTIGMAGGGLLWGRLADTRHLRAVVVLGALVLAVGLMAASRIETLFQLHAISFLLGAAGFACLFAPLASVVGLWFARRRGLAIGILTAGGAVGQGLVPLLMEWAIADLGWRGAYLWSGIAYLVILVPLMALITRAAPQRHGPRSGERRRRRLADGAPGEHCLAVSCGLPVLLLHGGAAGARGGADVPPGPLDEYRRRHPVHNHGVGAGGRIAIGMLADRTGALPAYMVASALQTATVFWFVTTPQMAIIIPVAIVFGFGFAGNMTSLILAVREAMPADRVGRATGLVGMVAWLGMGAGGYVSGLLFDVTASYTASFALAAAAGAGNLLVLILLHRQVAGRASAAGDSVHHCNPVIPCRDPLASKGMTRFPIEVRSPLRPTARSRASAVAVEGLDALFEVLHVLAHGGDHRAQFAERGLERVDVGVARSCGAVPRPHKSQVGLTDRRPASIISRLVRGSPLPCSHEASVAVRTPRRWASCAVVRPVASRASTRRWATVWAEFPGLLWPKIVAEPFMAAPFLVVDLSVCIGTLPALPAAWQIAALISR
jgi:MFS family permease